MIPAFGSLLKEQEDRGHLLVWCLPEAGTLDQHFVLGAPAVQRGPDPSSDQPHIINNHSKNSYHLNSTLHPQDAVKPQMFNHKQLS